MDSTGASHHEAVIVTLSGKNKVRGQMSHGVEVTLFLLKNKVIILKHFVQVNVYFRCLVRFEKVKYLSDNSLLDNL